MCWARRGRHSQSKVVGLAEVCQRQPGGSQQKAKLAKLCVGRHPKTGPQLEHGTPAGFGVCRFQGCAPAEAAGVADVSDDLDRSMDDEQDSFAECYVLGVAAGPPDGDHGEPFG